MIKQSKILKEIGKIWVKLAIALIVLSYCIHLFSSQESITTRIFSFLNIWNILISILIILPGYFCIVISGNIEKKNALKNENRIT